MLVSEIFRTKVIKITKLYVIDIFEADKIILTINNDVLVNIKAAGICDNYGI